MQTIGDKTENPDTLHSRGSTSRRPRLTCEKIDKALFPALARIYCGGGCNNRSWPSPPIPDFPIERGHTAQRESWIVIGVRVPVPVSEPAGDPPCPPHVDADRTLTGAPGRPAPGMGNLAILNGQSEPQCTFRMGSPWDCRSARVCAVVSMPRAAAGPVLGCPRHRARLAAAAGVGERGSSWRHRAAGRSSRGEPTPGAPPSGRWTRREAGRQVDCGAAWRAWRAWTGGYQGRYARDGARRRASRNATSGEQGPVRRRCTLASVDGGKDGCPPWIGLGGEAGGSWRQG